VDRIAIMLLFWVRSPARLSDEAYECLARLKDAGRVGAIGFSTHNRDLAADELGRRSWDVVMTRHSAAHPGAEERLMPLAAAKRVSVLTFSALVYGRMLTAGQAPEGREMPIRAIDCYRYSVSQPAVAACISAPRRKQELEENLRLLRAPPLEPEVARRLVEHGKRVREENRAFMKLVRGGAG
jgi:aryl-alcohol dehydrogenase-like predicted oxidoreductase